MSAMYSRMYRLLSLDYINNEESWKVRRFSGKFQSYRKRSFFKIWSLISMIKMSFKKVYSHWIYKIWIPRLHASQIWMRYDSRSRLCKVFKLPLKTCIEVYRNARLWLIFLFIMFFLYKQTKTIIAKLFEGTQGTSTLFPSLRQSGSIGNRHHATPTTTACARLSAEIAH